MAYSIAREELVVRSLEVTDARAVFECRTRPEVARYQGWFPVDVAEVEQHAREMAGMRPGAIGIVQLVIEAEGQFVGDFGIRGFDPGPDPAQGRQAELGIVLHPDHQGRGLATRACRLLFDDLFARGVHRVLARLDPANTPSQRLLERLGFRREGHERACYWDARQRAWTDELVYALLAREW